MNPSLSAYIKRYIWPLPKFKKSVVVMIDGKLTHGGLTDRFSLILSVYSYCKEHNIPFRLYYVYPCNIDNILIPNLYDWRISSDKISYSIYDSEELDFFMVPKPQEVKSMDMLNFNDAITYFRLHQCLKRGKNRQYRIYGNAFFARGDFKKLWNELFKPSEYLLQRLDSVRRTFICPYEAITLRFQQLLGDFKEGNFEVLSEIEKKELVDKCIKKIDSLYACGYFSTEKVLVTSDSSSFLDIISQKNYVYIVPGQMEHMDFTENHDLKMNTKSFVDLYMLSEARRVTLLKSEKMYKSGFPCFAAELGGVEYNLIEI